MPKKANLNFDPAKLSVLIVDDHPQMRKAAGKVLSKEGFETLVEVGNGNEALKAIKEQPFDLIILDLYLPDVSGFEILQQVRNREVDSDIPILVVTGEASKDEIVKAADLGSNDYLLKPFQGEDLNSKLTSILNRYHKPSEYSFHLHKGERDYFEKRYEDALASAEEAVALESNSVRARHLKAISLSKLGRDDEALTILKDNIQLNDNFYRTYAALGDLYVRKKQSSAAIDAMTSELELNPRQPLRQSQVATLLLEAGRIDDAITHFREALKENVKYRIALFGMGKAYGMIGNLEKSVYYYKRARRYYPDNTKALEAIVKVCIDAGEEKKAEYALRDEKNSNKKQLDTHLVLAKFYLATGEPQKALETLDEALVREPEYIAALKLRAATCMRLEDNQGAIDTYIKILKLKDSVETRLQFADVLIKSRKELDAIKILHGAMRQEFDYGQVFARLGHCYSKTSQSGKAYFTMLRLMQRGAVHEDLENIAKVSRHDLSKRRTKKVA